MVFSRYKMLTAVLLVLCLHQCYCSDVCEEGMVVSGHETRRTIKLPWSDTFYLCDVLTDGGGWHVIMRRTKGDINFNQTKQSYVDGFGTHNNDYWLGLYNIYSLIHEDHELRIDMQSSGVPYYAKYSQFELNGSRGAFFLLARHYNGTAGDGFVGVNGFRFSTYDMNYQGSNGQHRFDCAATSGGGWWYRDLGCHSSNLNGMWGVNMKWQNQDLDWVEMKVRPRSYNLTYTFSMWEGMVG